MDNNHMPFEHYTGQFTAGKAMLFQHDIVPFCANARENNPRRGAAGKEFSVCVPERNTVRVLHCNSSLHRESFVASFAPSRLRHSLPSMKSKALTSKFRYQSPQRNPRVPKTRPRPDFPDYLRIRDQRLTLLRWNERKCRPVYSIKHRILFAVSTPRIGVAQRRSKPSAVLRAFSTKELYEAPRPPQRLQCISAGDSR